MYKSLNVYHSSELRIVFSYKYELVIMTIDESESGSFECFKVQNGNSFIHTCTTEVFNASMRTIHLRRHVLLVTQFRIGQSLLSMQRSEKGS